MVYLLNTHSHVSLLQLASWCNVKKIMNIWTRYPTHTASDRERKNQKIGIFEGASTVVSSTKGRKKNKFSLAHMPFKSNGRKAVCVDIGSHNFTLIPFQTRREISPKPILSFCFLSLQLHFASQQQEPQMQESFALRCAQSSAEDKKKTHKPNRCQWRGRVEPHSFFTVSTLFSLTLPFTW